MKELFEMLSYRRPAGSATEEEFIAKFIDPLGAEADNYGNRLVLIGSDPTTMFSCHTDTVHKEEGRQKLMIDEVFGDVFADDKESNCLGADDAAGVFIMMEMIRAKVPGLYMFHREEEIGGGGSTHASGYMTLDFPNLKRCIAFDRKGKTSIITHQAGSRCCSQEFAEALADRLSFEKNQFFPDSTGMFTDSANYMSDIPECTNISVGYERQHFPDESQNFHFLEKLIPILISTDWDSLPTKRDPTVYEMDDWWNDKWPDDKWAKELPPDQRYDFEDYDEVYEWVYRNPEDAAALLCDLLGVP